MSADRVSALDDLATFLAHALALETEAQERHEELAHAMEAHNNARAAAVFHKLAGYGAQHAAEVRDMMADIAAPSLAPWDYDWGGAEAPETAAMEDAHYLMDVGHALQMALRTESRARDYYRDVAERARSEEVRRYASEFADEEAEHVEYVKAWIAKSPAPQPIPEDDDPPHMPE